MREGLLIVRNGRCDNCDVDGCRAAEIWSNTARQSIDIRPSQTPSSLINPMPSSLSPASPLKILQLKNLIRRLLIRMRPSPVLHQPTFTHRPFSSAFPSALSKIGTKTKTETKSQHHKKERETRLLNASTAPTTTSRPTHSTSTLTSSSLVNSPGFPIEGCASDEGRNCDRPMDWCETML